MKEKIIRIWRAPFLFLIGLYQKTLSPDHGFLKVLFPNGFCKYAPSCSQYGRMAIGKNGVLLGCLKTFWRILRCNPWSRGGEDLP